MTKDKMITFVNTLVLKYETTDPFRICRELNILVIFVKLIRVNGFYQRYEDQDLIYINQDLTDDEKILVCAHELGHALLHNDINQIFLETNKIVNNKCEFEANIFAVQLLKNDLNLREDLPLVDWHLDNYAMIRRIEFNNIF